MNQSLYRYKKRMLILCIMLAVVLMITGVSYAVFTSYSSQTDANTLAASCMDLEFNGQNEINLLNTYPISEGEALEQTPYTFTIKNKCDNYIEYYVIASVISTTNKIDSKYVKVSLLGDNDLNGTVINTLESISTPQSLSKYNITENYILKRGNGISKDESRTFNFRMWLDSNNKDIWTKEDIEGKDYQVKISVVGTVKTRPKDDLYVAALIDGVESSTFPTTDKYNASVECTRNGKKIDAHESITWNGTKWILSTVISDGNVRCNANFTKITSTEIITFTLEGTEYQAEAGMTFETWRDSKYNTFGYYYTNTAEIAKTTIESNKTYVLYRTGSSEVDKTVEADGYIVSNINETNFKSKIDAQILYHLASNDYEFFTNFVNNIDKYDYTEEKVAIYVELYKKMENTVSLDLFPLNLEEDTSSDIPIQKTEDGKYAVTIIIPGIINLYKTITCLKVLYFNGENLEIMEIPNDKIDYENKKITLELEDLSGFIFFYDKN